MTLIFGSFPRNLVTATTMALAIGCGHGGAPPASAPAAAGGDPAAPVRDVAPGARPEERNHLMEAQWTDVVIKARREDKEVVSAIKLVGLKLRLFHAAPPPEEVQKDDKGNGEDKGKGKGKKTDAGKEKEGPPPAELIDLAQELRKITPLAVDHIDILDGQVAFIDTSRKERPEIWLHDLQLSVENLTTRVHLGEGRPVLLTASGTLARSGAVSIFITADPFEQGLTFSGRAAVVGLQTAELYRFIQTATDMQAPRGTVDIFVEFDCRNGQLTGGVKPVLKNVEIRPASKNAFTVLKAWATDLAVGLFSDRAPQRDAVATVIPIKGTLTGPDVQLWPTIFGVMRNAFVEGLMSGYASVPPATAEKKQGVAKQAVDALAGSAPPKAQPTTQPDPAPPPPPPGFSPAHEHGAQTGVPVASTPEALMQDGAGKKIQQRLRRRGLLRDGQGTGQLDSESREALRRFQKSEGLPTTGLPSYETVRHLGLGLDEIFHTTARPRDPTAPAAAAAP